MNLFTTSSRIIRGTPLQIEALCALMITLLLVGCPTEETDVELGSADVELGSADNPWLVNTAAELRSIAIGFTSSAAANGGTPTTAVTRTVGQSLEEHYLQTTNITLCDDATNTTNCTAFVPIGSDYTASTTTDTPFIGSYDGGGNDISGLRVDSGLPMLPRYGHGGCSAL